jgi:5-(carboxyamino)imidazole ribonucleotide mutase
MSKKVAVLMGSDSDFPVMAKALKELQKLGIETERHVFSAHRTPECVSAFARTAAENGFGVIIAAAGKAAHLAGFCAAYTNLPVIGVPIHSESLQGLDALLSTVQMPPGIPVATVAVNGAVNAAVLAAQILAVTDPSLAAALDKARAHMRNTVSQKDEEIQTRELE